MTSGGYMSRAKDAIAARCAPQGSMMNVVCTTCRKDLTSTLVDNTPSYVAGCNYCDMTTMVLVPCERCITIHMEECIDWRSEMERIWSRINDNPQNDGDVRHIQTWPYAGVFAYTLWPVSRITDLRDTEDMTRFYKRNT